MVELYYGISLSEIVRSCMGATVDAGHCGSRTAAVVQFIQGHAINMLSDMLYLDEAIECQNIRYGCRADLTSVCAMEWDVGLRERIEELSSQFRAHLSVDWLPNELIRCHDYDALLQQFGLELLKHSPWWDVDRLSCAQVLTALGVDEPGLHAMFRVIITKQRLHSRDRGSSHCCPRAGSYT